MRINGIDLDAYGVRINDEAVGWKDGPQIAYPMQNVPGRGPVITGAPEYGIRTITASGWQQAGSLAAVRDLRDALWFALADRPLELELAAHPGRVYQARFISGEAVPMEPVLVQTAHRIRLEFQATDPLAYETSDTVVNFAGATATPLGTAPSRPVIQIAGAVSPTVIYRDASGTERGRMEFSGTIPGNNRIIVDCQARTIKRLDGTNAAAMLAGGDFITLDPKHGGGPAGPLPTLEIAPEASIARATYRRAFMSL